MRAADDLRPNPIKFLLWGIVPSCAVTTTAWLIANRRRKTEP